MHVSFEITSFILSVTFQANATTPLRFFNACSLILHIKWFLHWMLCFEGMFGDSSVLPEEGFSFHDFRHTTPLLVVVL